MKLKKAIGLATTLFSLVFGLFLFDSTLPSAHAATSSEVAQALSENLPIATYATPLSGASKVYASRGSGYIDTYVDRIVITDYTWNGEEVYVTYPNSSGGYLSRWFKTDDILGLSSVSVDKYNYTMTYRLETYRLNGKNSTTGAGWIGDGDDCVSLGYREINGVNYYPTIYPDNASSTINGIRNVKYHLRLAKEMTNDMKDVTKDFVGKSIMIKSDKNGKYLAAYGSNTNTPLLAITTTPSTNLNTSWEIFKVEGTSYDGWCGFKAYNGKWLSTMINASDDIQWSPIQAIGDNAYGWQSFRIYRSAAGDYYIRAHANNRFLTSRSDPSYPIVARFNAGDAWNSWTKFKIEVVQDNQNSLDQKINEFINDSRWANGTQWAARSPKLSSYGSSGCCAYTADFAKYVYGKNSPTAGTRYTSTSEIRKGDILHLDGHWMVILDRDGNSLRVAEANVGSPRQVRIGWCATISGNSVRGMRLIEGYHF